MYKHFMKLLAITGVCLCTALLFIGGQAYATHPCPEGTSQACCDECELSTENDCFAASAACAATPSPCFFGAQICAAFQADRDADCDQHLANFRDNPFQICMPYQFSYEADFNACVLAEQGACAITVSTEDCVADAASEKVACKQACPKGQSGKSCRTGCQLTFVAAVHSCHPPGP